jgi:hypothetical protein
MNVTDELGRIQKEMVMATKILHQDSHPPDWETNPGPPNYEAQVLTTQPQYSVIWLETTHM